MSQGQPKAAAAAFDDALRLDAGHAGALMGRARLALIAGDLKRVIATTQRVIDTFPGAEAPWQLRALLARRLRNIPFQIKGLQAVVERWPSDAGAWHQLFELYERQGASAPAAAARARVDALAPGLLGRK